MVSSCCGCSLMPNALDDNVAFPPPSTTREVHCLLRYMMLMAMISTCQCCAIHFELFELLPFKHECSICDLLILPARMSSFVCDYAFFPHSEVFVNSVHLQLQLHQWILCCMCWALLIQVIKSHLQSNYGAHILFGNRTLAPSLPSPSEKSC